MASTFDVVAIAIPKPGKVDRLHEILNMATKAVEAHEPDALRYHLQRETSGEQPAFIMLESFKNEAAFKAHNETEHFKTLVKIIQDEDLLAEPLKLHFTKPESGFASRL